MTKPKTAEEWCDWYDNNSDELWVDVICRIQQQSRNEAFEEFMDYLGPNTMDISYQESQWISYCKEYVRKFMSLKSNANAI